MFQLGAEIVEKATGNPGRVVMRAEDTLGLAYYCVFVVRTAGNGRHWKRQAEIKLNPNSGA